MNTFNWPFPDNLTLKIAYAGHDLEDLTLAGLRENFSLYETTHTEILRSHLAGLSLYMLPDVLLIEVTGEESFRFVEQIRKNTLLKGLVIVLLSPEKNPVWRARAKSLRVHDFYSGSFSADDISERLHFLIKQKLIKPAFQDRSDHINVTYKMPFHKRAFDVIFSFVVLFFLWPLLVIIAIAIRLESRGPIIYTCKRVGTGYRIFDFYKFRSMRADAELQLVQLSASHNQYSGDAENSKAAFVKIKNDPRITTVGSFLRNTSLDEIPQLFNVLIGDMSIVGNRPLALYEAEQLTSNEWSQRFLGPAGLTGLWQISRRGKEDMSERERKKLDNFYASKYSFWLDIRILIGTIPALIQKEKV